MHIKNLSTGMRAAGALPNSVDISNIQRPLDLVLNTFIEILCRPNLAEHLQKFFMQQIDKITSGCPDPNARLYFDYLSQHPEQLDKLPSLNINNEHIGLDLIRNRDSGQNQDDSKNTSSVELFLQLSQQSFSDTKPLYHHYLEIFPPSASSKTHVTPVNPPNVVLPTVPSSSSSTHQEIRRKKRFSFAGLFRRDSKQEITSIETSLRSLLKEIYIKEAKIERLLYREPDYTPLSLETNYLHLTIVDHTYQKKSEQQLLYDSTSTDFNDTYEKRFQTDKDIQIEELFIPREGETIIPHRLLLIGPAGSGKSIFCRYALYRWAQEKLWQKDYRLVVWIPLRVLTTLFDPYPTSIAGLIQHIYELPLSVAEIEKELGLYTPEKRLFVLDGLDEVSYLLGQQSPAQRLLEMLLMQPDILITTRPHQVRGLVGNIHRMVENLGFKDEHIEQYVKQFFLSLEQLEQAASCLHWLKSNPYLWGTAHVPINAELLCSLWEHSQRSEHHLVSTSLTMTEVYARIVEMLLDRQRSKEEAKQSIRKLRSWKPHQLYEYYQPELNLLKVLGLYGLEEHRIVLEASKLNMLIEGSQLSLPVRGSLEELVLKPVDPSLQSQDQDVYFIHLTFQEFFAAHFITQALSMKSSLDINRAVLTFIDRYRYHPQYQVVWRFVAGLLCQLDSKQLGKTRYLEYFLNHLVQVPRDSAGLYEALLLLQCLEEGKLAITSDKLAIYTTDFFQWLRVYVDTFIQMQSDYSSELPNIETLYLPFLPALTRTLVGCPRFTSHPRFRAELKNLAENAHPLMKQFILHLLQQIKIHDKEGLLLAITLYQALAHVIEQPSFNDERSIIRYLLGSINDARHGMLTNSLKLIEQVLLSIHPKYGAFARILAEFLNNPLSSFQEEIIKIIRIIRPVSREVREALSGIAKHRNKVLAQAAEDTLNQFTGDGRKQAFIPVNIQPQEKDITILERLKTRYPQLTKDSLISLAKQVVTKTCSDAQALQWIDWQLIRDHQQVITIIQQELIHLKQKEIQRIIKECERTCSKKIDSLERKGNFFLTTLSDYHGQVLKYLLNNDRNKFITLFLGQIGLQENALSSQKFKILKNGLLETKYYPERGLQSLETRVVILGETSARRNWALANNFLLKGNPKYNLLEDAPCRLMELDGRACQVAIFCPISSDSSAYGYRGQEDQGIKNSHVFILCYSITKAESFVEVTRLRTKILRIHEEEQDIPIILVGCKADREEKRAVSTEQGRALATKFGTSFFECSTKTGMNVDEVFFEAVRRHWGYLASYQPVFLETFLINTLQKALKIEVLKHKTSWVTRIIDTWLKMNRGFISDLLAQYCQTEEALGLAIIQEIKDSRDSKQLNSWLSVQLVNHQVVDASLMHELISYFPYENLPESTLAMFFELILQAGNYQVHNKIFQEILSSSTSSHQIYAVRFFIVTRQTELYEKELIGIIISSLLREGGNRCFAVLQLLNQWCPPNIHLIQTLAALNTDKNLECRRMSMKLLAGLVNIHSQRQAFQALLSCLETTPRDDLTEDSKKIPFWYEDNKAVIDALGTIEIKTLIIRIQHLPAIQFAQYVPCLRLLLWSKQIAFVLQEDHFRFFNENHQEVTLPAKEFDRILLIFQPDNKISNPVGHLSKKDKEELILEVDEDSLNEQSAASQTPTRTGVPDLQAYSSAQLLSRSLPFVASSSSPSLNNSQGQAASQASQEMSTTNRQI